MWSRAGARTCRMRCQCDWGKNSAAMRKAVRNDSENIEQAAERHAAAGYWRHGDRHRPERAP